MQLNYKWHIGKIANIAAMLSPEQNITYAASLLASLYQKHGDWHKAIRHYHSKEAKYHRAYSRKIVMCWLGI